MGNMTSERLSLLLFTVFAVGMTAGCAAAFGSGGEYEPARSASGAGEYIALSSLRNFPFFLCAFLPAKKLPRVTVAVSAALLKGAVTGCSGVYLLLGGEVALYCKAILPQLAVCMPALVYALTVNAGKNNPAPSYAAALAGMFGAALITAAVSCVQFALYFAIAKIV